MGGNVLSNVLKGLGCIRLIVILGFGAMAGWFTRNPEKVAEYGEKVTGIKASLCAERRAQMDAEWSKAVDAGPMPDWFIKKFEQLEAQYDRDCGNS